MADTRELWEGTRAVRRGGTLFLIAILLGSAALLAACGSATESTPTVVEPSSDGQVSVTLRNFAFEPQNLLLQVGSQVEFHLQSTDVLHTFTVSDLDIDWVVPREQEPQVQVVTFDRPGTFRLICAIPGHAGSGMVGTVEVR